MNIYWKGHNLNYSSQGGHKVAYLVRGSGTGGAIAPPIFANLV